MKNVRIWWIQLLFVFGVIIHYPIFGSSELLKDDPIIFETYQEVFSFIGKHELSSIESDKLFILAVDSKIDRFSITDIGDLFIVESNFYGSSKYNQVRGAQLNGRYYVLRSIESKFELIGILNGNGYRWNNVGKKREIISSWHVSAFESSETTYTWNGNRFEPFGFK